MKYRNTAATEPLTDMRPPRTVGHPKPPMGQLQSKRNGFGLRLTLIRCPRRLERLLLGLALAHWLLAAVGPHAARHFSAKPWCSNNKPWSCSLFTIGRTLLDRLKPNLARAVNQLRREVLTQNWG